MFIQDSWLKFMSVKNNNTLAEKTPSPAGEGWGEGIQKNANRDRLQYRCLCLKGERSEGVGAKLLNLMAGLRLGPGILALALLAGCMVGPDFERPKPPPVDRYTHEASLATTVEADGLAQRFNPGGKVIAEWWRLFKSAKLNAVVSKALSGNLSLLAAQANLRQSQASLQAGYGVFFPQLDMGFPRCGKNFRRHASAVILQAALLISTRFRQPSATRWMYSEANAVTSRAWKRKKTCNAIRRRPLILL